MSRWLLATGDFTPFGGMDRANHALADCLARREQDVRLIAHRVSPALASNPFVSVRRVARPFGSNLAGAPLLARAAQLEAQAVGPSARVLMNGGNGALGAPTWIHYLHAAYAPDVRGPVRRAAAAIGRRYFLARETAALTTAPLVICNSERTAADVQRHYRVDPARIRVVYYGSDAREFAPVSADERRAARAAFQVGDGRRIAAFVGALGDRRKGFDLLFDAWRTLSAEAGWDVDLLVAGSGAEIPAWRARARAAGLDSRIRFLGFRPDVAQLLAASDVLVHPARYEAYGLGVHEAICRGVPAIVTATSGVAEQCPPPVRGLLIPSPSVVGVTAALRAWREDADGWRARLEPAAAALRRRTWDDMAAEIIAVVS